MMTSTVLAVVLIVVNVKVDTLDGQSLLKLAIVHWLTTAAPRLVDLKESRVPAATWLLARFPQTRVISGGGGVLHHCPDRMSVRVQMLLLLLLLLDVLLVMLRAVVGGAVGGGASGGGLPVWMIRGGGWEGVVEFGHG